MRWRGGRRSQNVEDRRGRRSVGGRVARGGGGIGVIAIILVAITFVFPETAGILRPIIGVIEGGQVEQMGIPTSSTPRGQPVKDDETYNFVAVTLGYTEEVWKELFASGVMGPRAYEPPVLVLFEGGVQSRCGAATAANGPFYCPADRKIYIDPSFYKVMAEKLNAPGDFAQAYVIAHEVAHHVQLLTGRLIAVNRRRSGLTQTEGNRLTVRLELQADCFSGVWARRAEAKHRILEEGDLQEALRAAYQVGDDVIMRMSGRRVDETKFTHGRADQRARWFDTGFRSGDPRACDTFTPAYDSL